MGVPERLMFGGGAGPLDRRVTGLYAMAAMDRPAHRLVHRASSQLDAHNRLVPAFEWKRCIARFGSFGNCRTDQAQEAANCLRLPPGDQK